MPYYGGSIYKSRGGDAALEKRYAKLKALSREEGLLRNETEERKALIPDSLKTAFVRVSDFISRPNYATAGALDTLLKHGKPGEGVGSRVWRELSGVGDKEYFGEVLKQAGVPEGPKLSDLSAVSPGLAKFVTLGGRFDPSLRGAAGLGLDIEADPLSHLSAFVKGVAYIGRAGKVLHLTKAGQQWLHTKGLFEMSVGARKLGVLQGLDEELEVVAHSISTTGSALHRGEKLTATSIEDSIFAHASDDAKKAIAAKALEFDRPEIFSGARGLLSEEYRIRAVKTMQELAATGEAEAKGLAEGRKLRLFDARVLWGDLAPAGIPIADLSAIAAPVRRLETAIVKAISTRNPQFGELIKHTKALNEDIYNLFHPIPKGAAQIPVLKELVTLHHAYSQGAGRMADRDVRTLFKGVKLDKEAKAAFSRAADLEASDTAKTAWAFHAQRSGVDGEALMAKWKEYNHSQIAVPEVLAGLMRPDRVLTNYVRHIIKNRPDEEVLRAVGIQRLGMFQGADLGSAAKQRIFKNIETAEAAIQRFGLKIELELDPIAIMRERATEHYKAMADAWLEQHVVGLWGTTQNNRVRKLLASRFASPGLMKYVEKELGRTPSDTELDGLLGIVARSSTLSGREAGQAAVRLEKTRLLKEGEKVTAKVVRERDVETLTRMDPKIQTGVLQEMFGRVNDLKHFNALWTRYEPVIRKLGDERFLKAKEYVSDGLLKVGPDGQRYVKVGPGILSRHPATALEKGAGVKWELPEGVANYLTNFKGKWLQNPEVHRIVRTWDWFTNSFKFLHTVPWPGFHIRNAYSNTAQMALDIGLTALNPAHHIEGLRLAFPDFMGKVGFKRDFTIVTANGTRLPAEAVRQQMHSLDIIADPQAIAELVGKGEAAFPKKVLAQVYGHAQVLETEARAMHYYSLLKQGVSSVDAAARVKGALIDYSALSPFERNVMRRIFPFYTFASRNTVLQVRGLLTRPGIAAAQVKAFGPSAPDESWFPEYLRGDMKVKLTNDKNGNPRFVTGIDLPVQDINYLFGGSVGKTLQQSINLLNPMIKAPLEIGFGQDSYTGKSLRGRAWIKSMGPVIEKMPEWTQRMLEFEKVERKGEDTQYKVNGLKFYLFSKMWLISRGLSTAGTFMRHVQEGESRKAGYGAGLMAAFTGFSLQDIDITEAQTKQLRENIGRLEDYLVKKGVMAEFTKAFRPKETQP